METAMEAESHHREFTEETADDAAHHQDGDEDRDERKAHGQDGEADFLRALEGRRHGLHAVLEMAGNVLDDDDGVVDHEAGGDGESHEGKIIERVAHEVHDAESGDDRHRDYHAGNEGGPAVAKKQEDDENHEPDGD